ncbi:hypothetical protein AMJ44_02200 [candidate division WOR-1 bacterium DG_54_3]|uniref:Uncharacterized protein n=1 Tax=candidate division WOR-1 bacterium DG_54_3 TaxID=1703775 RepID=A0A0S7Y4Z4_UNCSA|nr:MAG: hypothetical protein AMJ44_02200 [candidate division WOR-1 bacterium DG_54_3]
MVRKTLLLTLITFPLCFTSQVQAQEKYVHPYNKILMKLYPRPFKLKWPDVPRILANEALTLYIAKKALFVRIGEEGGIVPGALYGKYIHKVDPHKIQKIAHGRMIILY